jgi:hypothetical protein
LKERLAVFAGNPAITGFGDSENGDAHYKTNAGAKLAREGGVSGKENIESNDAFASKPAPTGSAYTTKIDVSAKPLWERACSRRGPPCQRKRQESRRKCSLLNTAV